MAIALRPGDVGNARPLCDIGLYQDEGEIVGGMNDSARQFYDELAEAYHLIFEDWEQSILRQGRILSNIIQKKYQKSFLLRILDCSCGIGTQAIGLAKYGYDLTATDISQNAVARANVEARKVGANIRFGVADMRCLASQVEGVFDIVISCDNSLPHIITDGELLASAQNMWAKLATPGFLLISIRDYDKIINEKPVATTPRVIDNSSGRRIIFQVWDWAKQGHIYTINHFIIQEDKGCWQTMCMKTTYRALLRKELSSILSKVGFVDIEWLDPEVSGFYQPIVIANKKRPTVT